MVYHRGRYRIGTGQIIIAAIDDDLFGMIGKNDLPRIPDHIRQGRSAKTPVDDRISWKVTSRIRPFAERRTSYKKDSPGRGSLYTILMLELGDLIPERGGLFCGRCG